MGRLTSLTRDQAICGLALVVLATLACLSPVHNDTWWHLAYGREMATRGGFGQFDAFSYTATGRPFPNHQWLAERAMYFLWALGGMPLLTLCCAALLVIGWVLCWRLTRGSLFDRLLVTAGAAAGSTLVWSIRPQVFTVSLLPLVITLLVRQRIRWLPAIVLLWANLHGGVLLGLLAIGTWTSVALFYQRERFVPLAAVFALSGVSTFCTPLGTGYWPAVVASLQRSHLNRLQEWQPPGLPPEHVFFWGAAATLLVLTVRHWRRLADPADRGLVATALLFLPSACRSLRNVSPFMLLVAPALTRLLFSDGKAPDSRRSWRPLAMVLLATAGAAALLWRAWSMPWPRLGWTPLGTADIEAIRGCPGPIYNSYAEGGPIIWFVPSQPVFMDSRQDPYPDGLIAEATRLELGGDPDALFRRFGIECAALAASSPTGARLAARGWRLRHQSPYWAVYDRLQTQP